MLTCICRRRNKAMAGHSLSSLQPGPLPDIALTGSCCICLESLEKPGLGRQTLACGHMMHENCVTQMRRKGASGQCPICCEASPDLMPVQVLIDCALAHGQRNSFGECFLLLSQAYDIDPSNVFVSHVLGQMYEDGSGVRKDTDRALELYREANNGKNEAASHDL